jgi:hypothetical protein
LGNVQNHLWVLLPCADCWHKLCLLSCLSGKSHTHLSPGNTDNSITKHFS